MKIQKNNIGVSILIIYNLLLKKGRDKVTTPRCPKTDAFEADSIWVLIIPTPLRPPARPRPTLTSCPLPPYIHSSSRVRMPRSMIHLAITNSHRHMRGTPMALSDASCVVLEGMKMASLLITHSITTFVESHKCKLL